MKKILVLLLCLPVISSAQFTAKEFFKYSTVYGAVNGGNSLSDVDVYSVTSGLETKTVETPFDYSVLFGARKIKRYGYEPKEAFKNGTESSFSDGATEGIWSNEIEFLFQGEFKRQEGEAYFDQHHMVRYVADDWMTKIEYLEDGFADVKYFESSERYRYEWKGISFNLGIVQRMSEPYGYNPLSEWLLSNGNLHYTFLALEEGYSVDFSNLGEPQYLDPSGNVVATNTEVWEAVAIPTVLSNYTEKKRDQLKNTIQHSFVVGFDYYYYTKTYWLHSWGNLMPWHYNNGDDFSYHKYNNEEQWYDFSGGLIFGKKFNKHLGVFVEGKYNKYWNRKWHNFSVGINYVIF